MHGSRPGWGQRGSSWPPSSRPWFVGGGVLGGGGAFIRARLWKLPGLSLPLSLPRVRHSWKASCSLGAGRGQACPGPDKGVCRPFLEVDDQSSFGVIDRGSVHSRSWDRRPWIRSQGEWQCLHRRKWLLHTEGLSVTSAPFGYNISPRGKCTPTPRVLLFTTKHVSRFHFSGQSKSH